MGRLKFHNFHLHAHESVCEVADGLVLLDAEPGRGRPPDQHREEQSSQQRAGRHSVAPRVPDHHLRVRRVTLHKVLVVLRALGFAVFGRHGNGDDEEEAADEEEALGHNVPDERRMEPFFLSLRIASKITNKVLKRE